MLTENEITRLEELVNKKVPILSLAKKMGSQIISKKSNVNYISCPAHGPERTPSCNLRKGDNGWFCFGCHRGGHVYDLAQEYHKDWPKDDVLRWLIKDWNLAKENPWVLELLAETRKTYEIINFIETLPKGGRVIKAAEDYNFPIESYNITTLEESQKFMSLTEGMLTLLSPPADLPWEVVRFVGRSDYLAIFGFDIRYPWGVWGEKLGTFPLRSWSRVIKLSGKELNGKEKPENSPSPFLVRFYVSNPLDYLILDSLRVPVSLGAWKKGEFEVPNLKLQFLAAMVFEDITDGDTELRAVMEELYRADEPILFRKAGKAPPWWLVLEGKLKRTYFNESVRGSIPISNFYGA
jgi:hypothetical protein